MRSRTLVFVRLVIAAIVVIVAVVFVLGMWVKGGPSSWLVVMPLVAVAGLAIIFWREFFQGLQQDLPVEDERSQAIKTRAGYYAYLVSLYLWLALWFFHDRLGERLFFELGMVGMMLSFALLWWFFNRKESQ